MAKVAKGVVKIAKIAKIAKITRAIRIIQTGFRDLAVNGHAAQMAGSAPVSRLPPFGRPRDCD